MIEAHRDLDSFFAHELIDAQRAIGVALPELVELYLAQLLGEGAASSASQEPLVFQLAAAFAASDRSERLRRLQAAGDSALYGAGFFGEHLEGRGVSADYVVAMGRRAYFGAEELVPSSRRGDERGVFGALAEEFGACVRVLEEVKERSALRTPQDIVRLYDRWRRTRSPELAARLHRAGVFPTVPKPSLH